mmetsp:Transcript_4309/g.13004  ORF Transcript_4309/g.13004 Transcript_4309/m.13004 type:complete len:427 (-) Transcript_4309:343-1623(-)|eukprot:CAMPEP_0198726592 /NCGR_PEP_ID=MMETSP1475-20131203/3601_1 /TAXON_ID= ORGANISM="Unidentified sp., Strain CCMP1999" /NCGR_SAMPLE_ID=MMETSP1475 /ASSEMBLY_ACC=CAM_ASM_001111 /LENGTH=426 /DNA_ID=CAMNT_0044488533 /DNA_START=507 /DNA_END=1787 /DNA_ORIENTATION=+
MAFGGSGGFTFGAASSSQPSGSLFGATAGAPTGGGLFGASASAGGTNLFGGSQATSGSSLFGASSPALGTPTGASTGSLFGAKPAAGTGLFGGAGTTPNTEFLSSGSSSSLFGASTGSSLFKPAGQTGPSLFGASPSPGGSLFGGQSTPVGSFGGGGIFGASQSAPSGGLFGAAGTQMAAPAAPQLPLGLQSIFDAFNPSGPYCRFRHMLYNVVDPRDVARFQRPPDTDERLWEQARHNNPDPSRLVPVQASSFEQLHARVEQQNSRIAAHLNVLANVEKSVSQLQKERQLSASVKLGDYRRRHNELVQKLFNLIAKLEEALSRGQHLTEDEVAFRHGLEGVARQLTKPVQLADKLADLAEAAKASAIKFHKENAGRTEVDPRTTRTLKTLLTEQYKGISHLYTVNKLCKQDLEVLANLLTERDRR